MRIKPKQIYLFFILILLLIIIVFVVKKYVIEKYKIFRNIGLFPLKFDKIAREYRKTDNDRKKYTRHHYSKYKRKYNFLSQRNAGIRH
jgi:hypothetical protein